MTDDGSALLPDGLQDAMQAATGAHVAAIVPRAGGGASRRGAELLLRRPDGTEEKAYLSYDTRLADPRRASFFQREVAILRALSGPLAGAGVAAPRFLASDPAHLALLTALTPGTDKYHATEAPDPVGQDFIAQLAALHRIDPVAVPLAGFGDPAMKTAERIRQGIAEARRENLATAPDAVLLLALDWLEANIPPDREPSVIVHGDAGPGNFLHHDGRVTALLDWEFCHFGDPMEDLAQIWVRSLFQPFMSPRAFFAAYEAASGRTVDVDRVRYHRLYFQVGFTVSAHASLHGAAGAPPAALGVSMLFYTAHMRVIVRSLAELMGIGLPAVALPDSPAGWRDRIFALALDDLREVVVPRAVDQQAAVAAKSLARMIKFWRARDRHGAAFDSAEIAEIAAALKTPPAEDSTQARAMLARAVADRRIGGAAALALCHARVTRDNSLMADAMGAFAHAYFPLFEAAP